MRFCGSIRSVLVMPRSVHAATLKQSLLIPPRPQPIDYRHIVVSAHCGLLRRETQASQVLQFSSRDNRTRTVALMQEQMLVQVLNSTAGREFELSMRRVTISRSQHFVALTSRVSRSPCSN
jgi:hypothetical protein